MNKGTFPFLWGITKGSRKYFVYATAAMFIYVGFTYIGPALVGIIIDSVIGTAPFDLPQFIMNFVNKLGGREYLYSHLYICALIYLGITALAGVFLSLRLYFSAKLSEGIAINMRRNLHSHILRLPYDWHMKTQTGDTMQRCSSDVDTVRNFVAGQLSDFLRIIVSIFTAFFFMFAINLELGIITFLTIPLTFFVSLYFFKKIRRSFRMADEAEGALSSHAQESFAGVRVVKAFGSERRTRDRFDELNDEYSNLWIKMGRFFAIHWSIGDAMKAIQIGLVAVVGTIFVVKGRMSAGEFVSFLMYIRSVTGPIRRLARIVGDMGRAGISVDRIREVLDVPEEDVQEGEVACDIKGDIVFDNVNFGYEKGSDVLKDLSFTVKEGETFAILGGTGSGKSTITYLLSRLYDTDRGKITIGGVDVKKIQRDHLRRNIGLVLQEPFLFSKTIMENLRIIDPEATDKMLFDATETAAVHTSIQGFPHGYETLLGERGVTLSGGQKQRVAIARTLAANPPVLVFDDSLSAVDTETDAQIRAALNSRKEKATTIIISHRATTLMEADRIMVLAGGKIMQLGTHEELLKQGGIYSRVWNIQSQLEQELEQEQVGQGV